MFERQVSKGNIQEILNRYKFPYPEFEQANELLRGLTPDNLTHEQSFNLVECFVRHYPNLFPTWMQYNAFVEILGEVLSLPKSTSLNEADGIFRYQYRSMANKNDENDLNALMVTFVFLYNHKLFTQENYNAIINQRDKYDIAMVLAKLNKEILNQERFKLILSVDKSLSEHVCYVLNVLNKFDLLAPANEIIVTERLNIKGLAKFIQRSDLSQYDIERLLLPEFNLIFTESVDRLLDKVPYDYFNQEFIDNIFVFLKRENPLQGIEEYINSIIEFGSKRDEILSVDILPSGPNDSNIFQLAMSFYNSYRMNKKFSSLSDDEKSKILSDWVMEDVRGGGEQLIDHASEEDIYQAMMNYTFSTLRKEQERNEIYKSHVTENFTDRLHLNHFKNRMDVRGEQSKRVGIVGIIVGAILFTPLSLFITIPLFISARRRINRLSNIFQQGMRDISELNADLIDCANHSRSEFEIGRKYLENGNQQAAFRFFQCVPSNDSNYQNAMFECGNLFFVNGDHDAAQLYYEKSGPLGVGLKNISMRLANGEFVPVDGTLSQSLSDASAESNQVDSSLKSYSPKLFQTEDTSPKTNQLSSSNSAQSNDNLNKPN